MAIKISYSPLVLSVSASETRPQPTLRTPATYRAKPRPNVEMSSNSEFASVNLCCCIREQEPRSIFQFVYPIQWKSETSRASQRYHWHRAEGKWEVRAWRPRARRGASPSCRTTADILAVMKFIEICEFFSISSRAATDITCALVPSICSAHGLDHGLSQTPPSSFYPP
ncbi:hypothetical protein BC834DRAFT_476866 [Gloeopeniophorella convolvens]|nr:hypothetical protein BC834DRAFT_476866 [Gloeopeniophorella convolvens]